MFVFYRKFYQNRFTDILIDELYQKILKLEDFRVTKKN